ncbi:MAG: hypothetical protein NT049_08615 [Planctomycetota bacterium]|nr:hypothetical protein [Planctomycetota bacterium]
MALKLTDIGILIYIVMALYLAAAAAYANRRARASVVLAIISLIALILAGGFHVTARWGELQVWLNISVTWRERGTEDSKVFYCVSIVVFAALALQLAMTALFKAKRLAGTVLFGLGFVVA